MESLVENYPPHKDLVEPATSLSIIDTLLATFHEQEILYCHWKSNENLGASMLGDSDLDVLFDRGQKEKIEYLLRELDFRKFTSIESKQYQDIEDYIGFDAGTGKVVHLHAHFKLTMGENYLKGYQLNFENHILATRVFHEKYGIYHTNPSFELILLYLREAFKLRTRDIIMIYLFNRTQYTGRILQEHKWLKENATEAQIEIILQGLVPNHAPFLKLILEGTNRKGLFQLARLVRAEFRESRLYHPVTASLLRWYREAMVRTLSKLPRLLNRPIISRRINPRGGLTIAIVGADGSGKSTVTSNLRKTFQQKLDVYSLYFGRGDGNSSWPRKVLAKARALVGASPKKGMTRGPGNLYPKPKRGFVANLYRCMQALLVAAEKKRNLHRMQEAKKMGMLVICDRFPQNQIMGYNDGPLLHHLRFSGNPLFRALARYEGSLYAKIANSSPDIAFKLIADARVVEARKPGETSLQMLENKIEGIKALTFPKQTKVVVIDASQPLEEVLLAIKKEIWEAYA
ncbi:nucleoside/nucleotide kinase family protein [Rufibacter soli]